MKTKKFFLISLVLLTFICNAIAQEIITTTSVLSSAVKEIVKDKLTTETLVPSGYCPGHFDIKGKHLADIEKSGLLLAQGFEPYLKQIKSSIKNPEFEPVIIEIEGTWFSSENQKKIYNKITEVLSEKFPQHREFFEKNLEEAIKEIEKTDSKVRDIVKKYGFTGKSIICNTHIKEVLQYIGLNVVATYGRKEELTPSEIKKLIETGKKEKVCMVIDNLQAGPDTGKVIADELKVPHITISNFPEGLPETPTLRHTLYRNTQLIINTYEKYQDKIR